MSDLRREITRKNLTCRPHALQRPFATTIPEIESHAETAHDLDPQGCISKTKIYGLSKGQGHSSSTNQSLSSEAWKTYFDQELFLKHQENDQCKSIVYHAFFIAPEPGQILFVAHHGAGSSALSFARWASEVRSTCPGAGVLAFDARGHGQTHAEYTHNETEENTSEDLEKDFSLQVLCHDMANVIELTRHKMAWPKLPELILVGHSLGGAVAVDLATDKRFANCIVGVCLIDIVEGSAKQALSRMQNYLDSRPQCFESQAAAIDWHIQTRTIRSYESARISVPALIKPLAESDSSNRIGTTTPQSNVYTWRTNLNLTQPFWSEWFSDLSAKFLSLKTAKQLILAGHDRLDTPLTIAQMQGKFHFVLLPEAGHFIHEDLPEKTATLITDFASRNAHPVISRFNG